VPSDETQSNARAQLLAELAAGNTQALDKLLVSYRGELVQYVSLRLDPRLAARLDASDIVQEVQIAVSHRIDDYLARRPMPFDLWLRRTALDMLSRARRRHTRPQRSVHAEAALPDRTSLALARSMIDQSASPSLQAAAAELAEGLAEAMASLTEADREIVLMRQVEHTGFTEIALVLGISADAAAKRFARAVLKLQHVLQQRGLMD
jgi:RNA polymerase sigma-70 factor (ECF subfamily)